MGRKIKHPVRIAFLSVSILCVGLAGSRSAAPPQETGAADGPDPREIPVPRIQTAMGTLPGVRELPVRKEIPDVMVMNDGNRVTTRQQWQKRREEMRRILEYYAVGQMPPPPGNVKWKQVRSETVLDGKVEYRLVYLTFGPGGKLYCADQIYWLIRAAPASDKLETVVPETLWQQVQGMPAKKEVLGEVSHECAEISLTMPQAFAAALAGLRKLSPERTTR